MARRPKDDPGAPELSRGRIVQSAIELVDQRGLDDFSIRALARELGASNMSLYYYVKDREHLLELVLDEVLGSVNLRRLPNDPFDALALLAKRFVAAFAAHPGTIELFVLRPLYSIGPNATAVFDRFVELLRDAGLPDDTVADATVAMVEYLCGHLIGHLPQARRGGEDHGVAVATIFASLPEGAAPNIRAVEPQLRRAASTLQPSVGISMLLAGLRSQRASRTDRL